MTLDRSARGCCNISLVLDFFVSLSGQQRKKNHSFRPFCLRTQVFRQEFMAFLFPSSFVSTNLLYTTHFTQCFINLFKSVRHGWDFRISLFVVVCMLEIVSVIVVSAIWTFSLVLLGFYVFRIGILCNSMNSLSSSMRWVFVLFDNNIYWTITTKGK